MGIVEVVGIVMGSTPEMTTQIQFIVHWKSFFKRAGNTPGFWGHKWFLSVQNMGCLKAETSLHLSQQPQGLYKSKQFEASSLTEGALRCSSIQTPMFCGILVMRAPGDCFVVSLLWVHLQGVSWHPGPIEHDVQQYGEWRLFLHRKGTPGRS